MTRYAAAFGAVALASLPVQAEPAAAQLRKAVVDGAEAALDVERTRPNAVDELGGAPAAARPARSAAELKCLVADWALHDVLAPALTDGRLPELAERIDALDPIHSRKDAALAYLEDVERSLDGDADVRSVWLDKPREDYAPVVALELLTPLVDGEEDSTTFDLRAQGQALRVLYRPVALAGLPMGAVEVSRSTVPLDALITSRRRFQYAVAGTLVLLLVLAASVFSRRLVSRPMEALLESLRRIGEGDLSHRTGIDRRDEIGALAAGIDQMAEAMDRTVDAARLERRLRRSAERHLQTADRMLTVATVQNAYLHDIATPLGIVMGHANLLELQPDLNAELKGTAKSIREQVARVDMLVKRLRAAGDRRTVDGTADVQLTETISTRSPSFSARWRPSVRSRSSCLSKGPPASEVISIR